MNFRILSLYTLILCLTLSGVFGFTSPAKAQVNDSGDILIGLLPSNPGPNENVLTTIESYSINLDSAKIRWYSNGKLIAQGVGVKKAYIQTGALGSETTLKIIVDTSAETFTKTLSLTPASVSILWEARTYTPPFYKGKALFTHQSSIIFVATPNIVVNNQVVPKENLIYTWTKNGTVLGDQNGYGKYTLPLTGSVISRPIDLDLTVQDPKSGVSAFNTITVEPEEPLVLFYKKDPLYGTQYQKALSETVELPAKEITLEAVPFFFSTNYAAASGALSFNWSINGNSTNNIEGGSLIQTFRKVGDTLGISRISLSIEQPQRILQSAQRSISIDFTKETSATQNP